MPAEYQHLRRIDHAAPQDAPVMAPSGHRLRVRKMLTLFVMSSNNRRTARKPRPYTVFKLRQTPPSHAKNKKYCSLPVLLQPPTPKKSQVTYVFKTQRSRKKMSNVNKYGYLLKPTQYQSSSPPAVTRIGNLGNGGETRVVIRNPPSPPAR